MSHTLSTLLRHLKDKYKTSARPKRYFDVPKRGELTASEERYVKKRFKELVEREICVKEDPDNPECYKKVSTDKRDKKRRSNYLIAYEKEFRSDEEALYYLFESEAKRLRKAEPSAPEGLIKIALETGLPIKELKEVYDIGIGAYASSGSRAGMSAEQWGYGRVYAFIMSYFSKDKSKFSNKRFSKNNTDLKIKERIDKKLFKTR